MAYRFFLQKERRENCTVNIKNIIRIVSVIGQFGISIPFDIVFRMLEGEISYRVGVLLKGRFFACGNRY